MIGAIQHCWHLSLQRDLMTIRLGWPDYWPGHYSAVYYIVTLHHSLVGLTIVRGAHKYHTWENCHTNNCGLVSRTKTYWMNSDIHHTYSHRQLIAMTTDWLDEKFVTPMRPILNASFSCYGFATLSNTIWSQHTYNTQKTSYLWQL